ncbi:hypothetical protein CHUAL_010849 [Chamberlinius hualienensis]
MSCRSLLTSLWAFRRGLILILTPLVLLPLPLICRTMAANCAYVMLIMSVFWLTNAIHLGVVSMFPMALFPLFGIMDTNTITSTYFKDTNVVYLASLIIGISIEQSNFHCRIALSILLKIGTSPRMLLFGVMITTMIISMWIMNSVATAMMIPIVEAIFDNLQKLDDDMTNDDDQAIELQNGHSTAKFITYEIETSSSERSKRYAQLDRYKKCILLSVAAAANIGGTGTATSTSPNIVFSQVTSMMYGDDTGMSYATWSIFAVPNMLICTLSTYIILQLIFIGFRPLRQQDQRNSDATKATLIAEYSRLGPITSHEIETIICFIVLMLLYFFRKPNFMPGWESIISSGKVISDAVPAVLLVVVMCAFPSDPIQAFNTKSTKATKCILNWEILQNKVPWDLVLLQGCGYALAAGFKASELDVWLGNSMTVLQYFNPKIICYIVSLMASFVTEVFSNASTAAIMLPVVAKMAENLEVNPLYFMIPITICSSFSFMIPIATGPNAMVFKSGKMKLKDMAISGCLINCVSVTLLFLMINTLGVAVYDLNTFPQWANFTLTNTTSY